MSLADRACIPCRGGVPPLPPARIEELRGALDSDWQLNAAGHLERRFVCADFSSALEFANQVGAIAESERHHPDLHVAWGHCTVEIWTHKISGLTESDFILAAKFDRAWLQRGHQLAV